MKQGPIGVFDSGYGGLTILKEFVHTMPGYDYLYLGDNARSPYGTRSFETVQAYTLQCVKYLFDQGCPLVILACNTASAKALRYIQQEYLPTRGDGRRVLGIIIPTSELIGSFSNSKKIAIMSTEGTVKARSYNIEIAKFSPEVEVHSKACPMFVPLIENGEAGTGGMDYYIKRYVDEMLADSPDIDTILLGCTHYPLIEEKIREYLRSISRDDITIVSQGKIIARSLRDYLNRHPEMDAELSKNGKATFLTTEPGQYFQKRAKDYYGTPLKAHLVKLP